jgi:hypothetical protein
MLQASWRQPFLQQHWQHARHPTQEEVHTSCLRIGKNRHFTTPHAPYTHFPTPAHLNRRHRLQEWPSLVHVFRYMARYLEITVNIIATLNYSSLSRTVIMFHYIIVIHHVSLALYYPGFPALIICIISLNSVSWRLLEWFKILSIHISIEKLHNESKFYISFVVKQRVLKFKPNKCTYLLG